MDPRQQDQKLQVQQATDIVRLVGEHVALRPRGREFLGLCPFHDDRNPSLYVSPAKQIYKCFSCGAGGDVFSFVMNYHKMTFPEALRHLAEKAGIKLLPRSGQREGDDAGPSQRQLAAGANDQALQFFRVIYRHADHGKPGRDYIQQRGISPEMIEAFQIGYAPDRWDGLVLMAQQQRWDLTALASVGLVIPRERSAPQPSPLTSQPASYYDRFRHRVIFPIFDSLGRPIAFGGRKLREEDEPKYLNSPESALFNKSATLYGLHLAKKPIIDSRTAVIVEGYTDVIACHQAGIRNVVATLGTALTTQHLAELRRYADKVVLVYDADEAGLKASDRAVEIFLTEDLDVGIAVLPGGNDPAELFQEPDGVEQWNQSLAQARDALDFQFDRLRLQLDSAGTLTARQKLAQEHIRALAQLGLDHTGVLRRAMVVQRLSGLLHVGEEELMGLIRSLAGAGPRGRAQTAAGNVSAASAAKTAPWSGDIPPEVASAIPPHRITALRAAERLLLGCLLTQPDFLHAPMPDGRTLDEAITPDEMLTAPGRQLLQAICDRASAGAALPDAPAPASAQPTVPGADEFHRLLADLASGPDPSLVALATHAQAEVEEQAPGNEALQKVLVAAVRDLQGWRKDLQYRLDRADVLAPVGPDGPAAGDDRAAKANSLLEHHRQNPSPLRVPRFRG